MISICKILQVSEFISKALNFMSEEDGTADCSHMILASVGLQSFLFLRRKSRCPRAGATPASDTFRGQRRHSPTRSAESSDDPPSALRGKGRVGDQNATHTNLTPT